MNNGNTKNYRAGHVWRENAWDTAGISVDAQGRVCQHANAEEQYFGQWVLPGMPNLHSHAFQRAMAGLAERRSGADAKARTDGVASGCGPSQDPDSFWNWRETMYAFASRINPDQLQAIAAQLYVEMLKSGYTHVCEFHYLHHQPGGQPYADPAAMSLALIEAAQEAGIGLTLLPVLYMTSGFDGGPLSARQARFGHAVDDYVALIERLRALEGPMLQVGMALHSLRAVPADALQAVLASEASATGPIHIHIAEQVAEVAECLATRHARPVQWLLDHAAVDARWCLVHATHIDDVELQRLAATGAVAGLCPTTEANLGDGLFPLAAWLDAGGALGIGSDSHISVSPVEELRWLEYGQRLVSRQRNISARHAGRSVAETLWSVALAGGAQTAGAPIGALKLAHRADLLVLDDSAPLLAARDRDSVLDSFVFAGNASLVRDVMVGGQWAVRDHRHREEASIAARYAATVRALANA